MQNELTITVLGTTAAISSTIAFVPQIRTTWKTGGRDLSYLMLAFYVTGVSLWLCYGLAIRATALVLANAASIAFAGTCLLLKFIREKQIRNRQRTTAYRHGYGSDGRRPPQTTAVTIGSLEE